MTSGGTAGVGSARTRGQVSVVVGLGGLLLAAAQPLPYAAVLAVNAALAPDPERRESGPPLALFWASPVRWAAVVAWVVTVGVLLVRWGRPSGARVGAILAASVAAYVLVGGVGQAVTAGGGPSTVLLDALLAVTVYGSAWIPGGAAVAVCWWARRFA